MTDAGETSVCDDAPSSDSSSVASSLVLTWKTSLSSRKLRVSSNVTSRTVRPSAFILCLVSVSLLSSGLVLLFVSILIIINRCKYKNVLNLPNFDWSDLGLFSGLLSMPSFWITYVSHENMRNNILLPIVILCLILSLTIGAIGIAVTISNRVEFLDGFSNAHSGIESQRKTGMFQTTLKTRMMSTMQYYHDQNNTKYQSAWDDIHRTLTCCGVDGPLDWSEFSGELPLSCYQKGTLVHDGCLEIIAVKLAGQMSLSAGVSLITFTIQTCSISLIIYTYKKDKRSSTYVP